MKFPKIKTAYRPNKYRKHNPSTEKNSAGQRRVRRARERAINRV